MDESSWAERWAWLASGNMFPVKESSGGGAVRASLGSFVGRGKDFLTAGLKVDG